MKSWWVLPWLGVLAAGVLLVNLNVLGARWYKRWDLTSDRLYTLSGPTRELLRSLDRPVDVTVLLSNSDPLTPSVRHMLESYATDTRQLRVRYVDPDRSPAEFLAVQQKYQILAGKAEDGRIVTDAAIVVAWDDAGASEGGAHWFITADELVHLDEDSGRSRPALEQALSSALANVRRTEKAKLCFSAGHLETSLDDAGPEGLSELKQRLLKNNYTVETVDLTAPQLRLEDCSALVVAAPKRELGSEAAQRVGEYVKVGGSALLLLPPTLGDDKVRPTGLEAMLSSAGITLGQDVVLERDAEQRLPRGSGELFFAKLLPHAVTRGVRHEDEKLSSRVLVVQARSLSVTGSEAGAKLLLQSSEQALSLKELSALADSGRISELEAQSPHKSLGLAAACQLGRPPGGKLRGDGRLFVTGASNLGWNRNFHDPALYGNQRLIENAISWIASHPVMISVPEKSERELGLSLSEESLGEVARYVLLYMPGSVALLGAFVLLRRRNAEKRSRAVGEAKG
ncbi:MAG TPA: GldG family protein [Polyangiaceae bacterium]|nr:GldG family protein [Polyangiaceae bacterium]